MKKNLGRVQTQTRCTKTASRGRLRCRSRVCVGRIHQIDVGPRRVHSEHTRHLKWAETVCENTVCRTCFLSNTQNNTRRTQGSRGIKKHLGVEGADANKVHEDSLLVLARPRHQPHCYLLHAKRQNLPDLRANVILFLTLILRISPRTHAKSQEFKACHVHCFFHL